MIRARDSPEQLLDKCLHLKARDLRHPSKNATELLERLTSTLESSQSTPCSSLRPLIDLIANIISSIDHHTLWKPKGKTSEQLAQTACRLLKCLCSLDAECANSDRGTVAIRSILHWLRLNLNLHSILLSSQDLYSSIYSCLQDYSLICQNTDGFLDELLSASSAHQRTTAPVTKSCFSFARRDKVPVGEPPSAVDTSVQLVIYLLQSPSPTSPLLVNQIFTFFLTYAPVSRFSQYLVHRTDFYHSIVEPFLSPDNRDCFVQSIIDETARSQTDSSDRVFVFTHVINLLGEFALHAGIRIDSTAFMPTFKSLFDALVECGTTAPLWSLMKCLSNLLTSADEGTDRFAQDLIRMGLLNSIRQYASALIGKSTLGQGRHVLTPLHHNVLISCLSIFYNISTLEPSRLDPAELLNPVCRPLLSCSTEQLRLMSCLLYSNLLTEKELEVDHSCHHLSKQLFLSIRQASASSDYHLYHQISLLTLVACLKNLSVHKQFQKDAGDDEENINTLFRALRTIHSSADHTEEIRLMLEAIWFLSFDSHCASAIHSHDQYFALLVQFVETHSNDTIRRAAGGILWQMKKTLAITDSAPSRSLLPSSTEHIMLSYNHDSKDLVDQVCQRLRHEGYRIWIDTEHMHGSTLECMAHAVEQAMCVIVCMTEKYKQSPNCQSEAEYAYRLKKPLVPILFQAKYRPDGWLGMLLGTRLYIDFTKHDFEWNAKKLIREIQSTTVAS